MSSELDARALERAIAENDGPARRAAQVDLAWAIALQDRLRSRQLSESALGDASPEESRTRLRARRNLTYLEILEGKYMDALGPTQALVEAFRATDDVPGLLSVMDMAVHCWEAAGDYGRAMEMSLDVQALAEKENRPRERAWAITNLGSIHARTGDLEASREAFERALEIFYAIRYATGVTRVKAMLGGIYRRMGRVHDALATFVEVLQLYRDLHTPIGEAQALTDMGEILLELDRADDAKLRFRAAVKMFEELGNDTMRARVQLRLARVCLDHDQPDEAHEELEGAQRLLHDAGATPDEVESLCLRARIHEVRANHQGAAEAWRQAFELQSRVHDDERKLAFERVRARVEVERAEMNAEIHRLKYEELANLESQHIESARLALVGDLAAGVAHEINTPLGALSSNLDVMTRALERWAVPSPELARYVKVVRPALSTARTAAARINEWVQSLKRFSRLDEARRQRFDVNEEVENVAALVQPKLQSGVTLCTELGAVPTLDGVPSELNQALLTLLVNAAEATSTGTITVRTRSEDECLVLDVEDSGKGMNASQLEHLFEPGFSRDGGQVRFRVGLPSAAAAIRRHGGDITVRSESGLGTCFTITMPLESPQPTLTPSAPPKSPSKSTERDELEFG